MSGRGIEPRPVEGEAESDRAVPGEVDTTAALLAGYPHVVGCAPCLDYAGRHERELTNDALVSATLAHHAADHLHDPLTVASQHFA